MNQCWIIMNGNLQNKFQWNLKQNSYIFLQQNAFEDVIQNMTTILSKPKLY